MDFDLVINRNRDLLLKIITALYAMAGLAQGAVAEMMPRRIYGALLLVLRPAESAVRRLILIAAQGLVLKRRTPRPLPAGLSSFPGASGPAMPAFCLFDSLKRFDLDNFDPDAPPRHGFSGVGAQMLLPSQLFVSMDELVSSVSLCQRLNALKRALVDLPAQARRLVRWQVRRDFMLKREGPWRPIRMSPCRPGLPPGYRKRQLHEVDEILRDCHYFAHEAMSRPDTS